MMDFVWKLCNMVFQSSVVAEDGMIDVNVPLDKGKGQITERKNYCRGIC